MGEHGDEEVMVGGKKKKEHSSSLMGTNQEGEILKEGSSRGAEI